MNLDQLGRASLVMLDGLKYQRSHHYQGKLCDRIIFGQWARGDFVCAVEFKGGRNIDVDEALEQIQNGLNVASELLPGQTPDDWYPILLYRGRLKGAETTKLRARHVSFQAQRRESSPVIKRDCGSSLIGIMEQNVLEE